LFNGNTSARAEKTKQDRNPELERKKHIRVRGENEAFFSPLIIVLETLLQEQRNNLTEINIFFV